MAKISDEMVSLREQARDKKTGKFGEWERAQAGITLQPAQTVQAVKTGRTPLAPSSKFMDGRKQQYLDREKRVQQIIANRRKFLAETGEIQPGWIYSSTGVQDTSNRDIWWDRSRVMARYSSDGVDVPMMPDDESIQFKDGNAISGKRRTYRARYKGFGDNDIRMPSVASVNRFLDREGIDTVRIPVQLQDDKGNSAIVNVTATRNGPEWDMAVDLDDPMAKQAAFVAKAALERRNVTETEWKDWKNIHVSDYDEITGQMDPDTRYHAFNSSSAIEQVAYRKLGNELDGSEYGVVAIKWRGSTKPYGYRVNRASYESLVKAKSPGRIANQLKYELDSKGNKVRGVDGKIKMSSRSTDVSSCPDCGAYVFSGISHSCPGKKQARPDTTYIADARRSVISDGNTAGETAFDGKNKRHSNRKWFDVSGIYHSGKNIFKRKRKRQK